MIRKVHFKNFRSLRDVELTLEPLTVLVGPNSSGKTTVLEGLRLRHDFNLSDLWRQERSTSLSIQWSYDDGLTADVVYDPKSDPHPRANLFEEARVRGTHRYQSISLDLDALRQENLLAVSNLLEHPGDNLANVFYSLGRKQQSDIAQELCRLVPMFSDVDLQPTGNGKHRLRFQDRWAPGLWFAPNEVSDGTMLLLAFLVLQYQNPAPDLITIEEPERALHPYLLDELIQLLRKMTTGEIGKKPVQVVLATHSAELLDYVRPEEVRFLTRSQEDGSVRVNQAATDTPNWRRVYETYKQSLGGIWLSGGMGGVPGA